MNLKRFCLKDSWQTADDAFEKPWSAGEYTYATDRNIAVRIPRDQAVGEARFHEATIDKLLAEFPPHIAFQDLPGSDCPECDGSSILVFHSKCFDYEVECRTCSEEGQGEHEAVQIGPIFFQRKYVRLMQSLPCCKIAVIDDYSKPSKFVFDGGEGLIMGYRPSQAEADKIDKQAGAAQ